LKGLRKTLRGASLGRLVRALTLLGYRFCKLHHYKCGKFHVIITAHSQTRIEVSLHRDRRRLFTHNILSSFGHEAVWTGRDVTEEMNKILAKYRLLKQSE